MLCADVIGFHAFDHARHFLNACKRILGLSYFNKSGCASEHPSLLGRPTLFVYGLACPSSLF